VLKIKFKDVGQGDSILITWTEGTTEHYGIVDCNLYGSGNPMLDEVQTLNIKHLDFIILSHLHADHFSGMPELLEYCFLNRITIGTFLHTFENQYFKILNEILLSQKNLKLAQRFLKTLKELCDSGNIKDIDRISNRTKSIKLGSTRKLQFLSPIGKDYLDFADDQAKYVSGRTTALPDLNSLSCVSKITDGTEAILLTADITKKPLQRLTNIVSETISCLQVPHHGSDKNHVVSFLESLKKKDACPAVFSVGDVRRDKLPKRSVVEYYDSNKFEIHSTNFVYGLAEHFNSTTSALPTPGKIQASLANFSRVVGSRHAAPVSTNRNYNGDCIFIYI
jgi:beta-lactamase superfamily II metal-dependent hydrolase